MQSRLTGFLLAIAGILASGGWAAADSWSFPAEVVKKNYEFGKSKIVLEVDGVRNQGFPPHTLFIYLNGELAAKYGNVGFSHIFASEDNRYFVGLSNDGIPGTAFVIFDAEGNLIREMKHRFMPRAIYTAMSITRLRRWFDVKNPAVEFKLNGPQLINVFVQGDNGQRYDLMQPDLGFVAGREGK